MLSYIELPPAALLAVSGGGDSVALACMVNSMGITAAIGHVRHGDTRWQMDAEQFVAGLAQGYQFPYYGKAVTEPVRGGQGYEAKCRKLRYQALSEIIEQHQLSALVTAHTRDDFAETVAIAIRRRQGLAALAGIPARRMLQLPNGNSVSVLRPMLHLMRSQIREWLQSNSVPWLEDPTNTNPSVALRNAIRSEWSKLTPYEYETVLTKMEAIAEAAQTRWKKAEQSISSLLPGSNNGFSSPVVILTDTLSQLDDDAMQVLFHQIAQSTGLEAGSFPRGHRNQFARTLNEARWGATGSLGKPLHYRITKRNTVFTLS